MVEYGDIPNLKDLVYLQAKDGIVTDVSLSFSEFTGYCKKDILSRHVSDVFRGSLRIAKEKRQSIDSGEETVCYIFIKSLEAREVSICIYENNNSSEKIFIITETPDSRPMDKLLCAYQICDTNFSNIAVFSSPDLILLQASQKYLNALRAPYNTKEFALGTSIEDITPGWESLDSGSIWKNVIEKGEVFKAKEFYRSNRYWDILITPIHENGVIKFCIINATDVTEKVLYKMHMEQQAKIIKQQKEQLEAIIENMSDALFVVDKEGNYVLLNKSARSYFAPDSIHKVGDAYMQADFYDIEGNKHPYNNPPIARILIGETITEYKMKMYKDNKEIFVSISGTPIFDDNGHVLYAVLCSRDITEQVKSQNAMNAQRSSLVNLINTIDIPIMRVSFPELKIIDLNRKGYKEILSLDTVKASGRSKIELGESILSIFPDLMSGVNYKHILEMEHTKCPVYLNNTTVSKNGSKSYMNLLYQPIFDKESRVVEFIITAIDVTSEVERKIELERIMNMKDEFLSIVSHEFKTPLTVITSAIQAMKVVCKDDLTTKTNSYIDKIRQSTFRQLRLVNNILDFSRINSGIIKLHKRNLDIVFLTKAITESVSLFAQQKGVSLAFNTTLSAKTVGIDDEKYERIMLNLLSNAIKFTPKGKSILVKLSLKRLQNKSKLCIQVKDDGVGIPKEKQEIIFERFGQVDSSFTRQAEGTGLGLSLVKILVKALEGEITVESKVGKGSTFTVTLPADKVPENSNGILQEITDNRLIQATTIEFSDIYLSQL